MTLITGYAATFGNLSVDLGGFIEKIRPGAFAESLRRGDDVRALVDHNASLIIGRSTMGTLRLWEDKKGLRIEIDPPSNAIGQGIVESIRRGDVNQMSFAFYTVKDDWFYEGDQLVRNLIACDLIDVSLVTYPAYPSTSCSVRSAERFRRRLPGLSLCRARLRLAHVGAA